MPGFNDDESTSEIGKKSLLQRLGARLGVVDLKQAPSRLNVRQVQVVSVLDGPATDYTLFDWGILKNMAALANYQFAMGGPKPAGTGEFDTSEKETRLLELTLYLTFTAGGAVAFAGKQIGVAVSRLPFDTTNFSVGYYNQQAIVVNAVDTNYTWTMHGYKDKTATPETSVWPVLQLWIPQKQRFYVTLYSSDATVFPAATFAVWAGFVVQTPPGIIPPL
ncbi:MAG: hypothetical protein AABN95_26665 [Acidobacteriota bacterium]